MKHGTIGDHGSYVSGESRTTCGVAGIYGYPMISQCRGTLEVGG